MNNKTLFITWGGLYALCAILSLIPAPGGVLSVILTLISIIFFVPPALLILRARRDGDDKTRKALFCISALSLGLTVLLFIFNILSILGSALVGNILYYVLLFVSVPMVCSRHYLLSVFLWACLLFCALPKKKVN